MFYLCIESSLLYLSVGAMRGCVVAVAVGVPGRDSCVRVSVAGFNVLCAVVFRLGASYFLPVGSLVVLLGISECAHGQWAKPIHSLFIVNLSLYFITYNHRYYHICQSFCINLI